ncbi:hypothetical protein ACFL1A_02045 [Patescibacteria group bacterium]
MRKLFATLILLFALFLILTACGSAAEAAPAEPAAPAPTEAPAEPAAPSATVEPLDNASFTVSNTPGCDGKEGMQYNFHVTSPYDSNIMWKQVKCKEPGDCVGEFNDSGFKTLVGTFKTEHADDTLTATIDDVDYFLMNVFCDLTSENDPNPSSEETAGGLEDSLCSNRTDERIGQQFFLYGGDNGVERYTADGQTEYMDNGNMFEFAGTTIDEGVNTIPVVWFAGDSDYSSTLVGEVVCDPYVE